MTMLLITDLDNTLYDWVTYYARAFRVLVDVLVEDLGVDREKLLDEFKTIHQLHGDSEYPLAVFELPSVQQQFACRRPTDLRQNLDRALRAFNESREKHLHLYDCICSTLTALQEAKVVIVGHTEANAENALFRLRHLGVVDHFRRVYALERQIVRHGGFPGELGGWENLIRIVPRSERKPNPKLVIDICEREGVRREDVWYVGDSLTRDIWMAKAAGVRSVWAHYGTQYDRLLWDSLVRITHWTAEDVAREAELRQLQAKVQPDFVIDSFHELLQLMGVG